MTRVLKISGHELDDPAFLDAFAGAVAALREPVVIVHGGGKEITALQQVLGIEPRYVDGLRITDAASLSVIEMVLAGTINKRLVARLLRVGVDALGLSGVDRRLMQAAPMQHPSVNMGFTGTITRVRAEILSDLLGQGVTPVIAPVCYGDHANLNVNADHVAGALAAALGADQLVFLSNVAGVLVDEQVVSALTPAETERLIAQGVIFGGMIPKVRTALQALDTGAMSSVITNLVGLAAGTGTHFRKEDYR